MKTHLLKIIYSFLTSIITGVAYGLVHFIDFADIKDLTEMFFGSSMISISLIELSIDTKSDVNTKFPYTDLIALATFTAITFYKFIRESFSILDETLLIKCDTPTSMMFSKDEQTYTETEVQKFNFFDKLCTIFLFIISCIEGAAFALATAAYESADLLNHRLPLLIPIRFIMYLCVALKVKEMNISTFTYFILAAINALVICIFGSIPQFISTKATEILFSVSASLMLGFYLYYGGSYIHDSRMMHIHSEWLSILAAFLGFILPIIFRVFVKNPSN